MIRGKDSRKWSIIANVVLLIFTICAVLPLILLISASFSSETDVLANGYSFWPRVFSIEAYRYIFTKWSTIGRAYLMTIIVAAVGVTLSIIMTTMFAYVLTNEKLPGVRFMNLLTIFTMLFSGGVVASYYIWSSVFHIRDTIWALLLPNLLMNGFNVILVKNYFTNSIPHSLIEAARIDGCSEFRAFWKIVMPLSIPINATIGLMTGLAYWNDWTNGLYYLSERNGSKYYTIQLILNQISSNISWLTRSGGVANASSTVPNTTARMAIGLVGILPILIIYPFLQKYFVKGITVGAVKE